MKRAVIFAHYDFQNIIDDYVIYYLKQLKYITNKIVFVSDNNLSQTETDKLSDIADVVIAMRHEEYDFGSYKYGYKALRNELADFDELILCNDSCFGPFWDLSSYFEKMQPFNYDMWGMIGQTFVQSFFLVLKKRVFLSNYFQEFMNGICHQQNKTDVVEKYEKGLTNLILAHKGTTGCLWQFGKKIKIKAPLPVEIRRDRLGKLLDSYLCADVYTDNAMSLIEEDFPFMKKLL